MEIVSVFEKVDLPVDVFIWDEIAMYKADWVKVGRARTSRGLDLLIGKARARAKKSLQGWQAAPQRQQAPQQQYSNSSWFDDVTEDIPF